jgi:hypothetical protein
VVTVCAAADGESLGTMKSLFLYVWKSGHFIFVINEIPPEKYSEGLRPLQKELDTLNRNFRFEYPHFSFVERIGSLDGVLLIRVLSMERSKSLPILPHGKPEKENGLLPPSSHEPPDVRVCSACRILSRMVSQK